MANNPLTDFLVRSQLGEVLSLDDTKPGQMRFTVRVPVEQTGNWLLVFAKVVRACRNSGVGCDLSKAYILQDNDVFLWTWRVILQHPEVKDVLPAVMQQLASLLAPEDREFPLHANPNRHRNVRPTSGGN